METMEKQMYLAAQYLAAAGINYVPKKEDDSHTNLGFSIEKKRLETHLLSGNGDILSLDYDSFGLQWDSQNHTEYFPLHGITHKAVVAWLNTQSERFLAKPYSYGFHYELPYNINDDFRFELSDAKRLAELTQLRILAQAALTETLSSNNLESPIRVWPHHFDSGAYASLNGNSAVGFGLAIPDSVCSEHYFYISGYKGHDAVPIDGFSPLSKGEWKNDGFTGAIFSSKTANLAEVVSFFTEAIESYKK